MEPGLITIKNIDQYGSEALITNNIRVLNFHHREVTQSELAQKVGVTTPSLELAFRIARVFDRTVEEGFQFKPDDP